jgi:hypothetical protein
MARLATSATGRGWQAPAHRLAMTRAEAARALGVSINSIERHVQPELRVVRRGMLRLIPVRSSAGWRKTRSGRLGRHDGASYARRDPSTSRRGHGQAPSEGTSLRHARSWPARSGGRCRCTPHYQAQAWSPRDRKRLTRTFPTLAAARGWRYDAPVGLRHGTLPAAGGVTLRQAADESLAAAEAGLIRNRSGNPYKPSALRGYEQWLQVRSLSLLGGAKLVDIRRSDVQRLVTG